MCNTTSNLLFSSKSQLMQGKVNESSGVMNEGGVMQQGQRAREGDQTTLVGESTPFLFPKIMKRPSLPPLIPRGSLSAGNVYFWPMKTMLMSVISGGGEEVAAVVRMRIMRRRGRKSGCIALSFFCDSGAIARPRGRSQGKAHRCIMS